MSHALLEVAHYQVPQAMIVSELNRFEKAIDTVFRYLGREEASIRQNPTARTTDLLKKVFS